jgi:hypothetical protein
MIFDRLHVASKPVARVEHRGMSIGKPRTFVEMAARQSAQAIKMRLDVAKQRLGQMNAQQIRQRWISTIKIHAGRIRRQQIRMRIGIGNAILRARLH